MVIGDECSTEAHTMTTLLFVRHAEVHNPDQILYGRLPRFRLSDAGRMQAERLARFLAPEPIALIYTSPLLRARHTATAIAAHHPRTTVRRTQLLHEVGSAWQGTAFSSFADDFNTYDNPCSPGDESVDDILRRMLRFLRLVCRRHPAQRILAVSHGDPITILRVYLKREPLTIQALRGSDYADLCSVTEINLPLDGGHPSMLYRSVPADI
jgi:broad specificity phosphatase PhoE